MKYLNHLALRALAAYHQNTHAQDLIEYSLMAGFVATTAGAIMPGVAGGISTIFSKIGSVMNNSASQGNPPTG